MSLAISKRETVTVVLILFVAFILRMARLSGMSLWLDEALGISMAMRPFPEMFSLIRLDVHPPLYHLLLKGMLHISASPFFLRLTSVFFGIAAIGFFYLAMRRYAKAFALSLALIFLTLSPVMVHYSQEIRMYALLVLLANLALWAALRLVERPDATSFAIFGLTGAACLYTHYIAGIFVIGLLIFVMWERSIFYGDRPLHLRLFRGFMDTLRTALFIFILYLPWYETFCEHLLSGTLGGKHAQSHLSHFLRMIVEYFTQTFGGVTPWVPFGPPGWILFFFFVLVLFFYGLYTLRGEPRILRLSISILGAGFILIMIHLLMRGRFYPRCFIIYLPLIFYVIGRGMMAISSRLLRTVSIAYLALCLFVPTVNYLSVDVRDVSLPLSRVLNEAAAPGEPILHTSKFSYFPMIIYLPAYRQYLISTPNLLLQERMIASKHLIRRQEELSSARRLWLVVEYWGQPVKWDLPEIWSAIWLGREWHCTPVSHLRMGVKDCIILKCEKDVAGER
jgi:uncharacterized membrane protein